MVKSTPAAPTSTNSPLIRPLVATLGVVGALLCLSGVVAGDLSSAGRASLAVASLAVGLWGSELIPMPVTGLSAMALLYITGARGSVEGAFAGFASPVLFFLIGSAALGIAGERSGLVDRMAVVLIARSRGSGHRLLAQLLLSMPMQALVVPSAMSRNAVLVPLYDRVLKRLGEPPRLSAAVMLNLGLLGPLASTALLSGGTSPVAAAQSIGGFNWISWLVAIAPPYYVMLALSAGALWLTTRPEKDVSPLPAEEKAQVGPVTSAEKRTAAVAVATSILWMLDVWTGWSPAIPALLATIVLLLPRVGVIDWRYFVGKTPWATVFVLASAVSVAATLSTTGAATWMANGLFGQLPVADGAPAAALTVYVVSALIALAIPNRAAAITLIVPLATAYSGATALSPVVAGLVVLIAVDVESIYPAQTAANLIAYERGHFSSRMLVRFNATMLLIAAAVIVLFALPWWSALGLT